MSARVTLGKGQRNVLAVSITTLSLPTLTPTLLGTLPLLGQAHVTPTPSADASATSTTGDEGTVRQRLP